MDKFGPYPKALRALQDDNRLRGLNSRAGIDFSSNDYLALASASRMKKAIFAAIERGTPLGSGGSRLLRGNCEEHECFEAEAAQFFGAETALFFASGHVANFAVLTTLPQRGDLLVLDCLVHASIHEGARAGRAEFRIAGHNDLEAIESAIRDWRADGGIGRVWIVAERIYSMDGDFAPLDDLVALADRYDAFLVVHEAMLLAFTVSRAEGSPAITVTVKISWSYIPAERRWEWRERLSLLPVCYATL